MSHLQLTRWLLHGATPLKYRGFDASGAELMGPDPSKGFGTLQPDHIAEEGKFARAMQRYQPVNEQPAEQSR